MTQKPSARRLLILLGVLLILGALGVIGAHWQRKRRVDRARRVQVDRVEKGPKLFVAPVETTAGVRDLTLPGEVRAFQQATVYAKVAGYLKNIRVDKGDEVKADQLIATIESPETDKQVLATAADLKVKERLYERARTLAPKGYIAQQDLENAHAAAEVARATLQQVKSLQEYEQVRAPFDGTVTARYVDPGALVPAATGATTGALPLVDISDARRLRVAVFVGQDVAPFLSEQTQATIVQDERPDLKIDSHLARISGALDPRSRTMLCEVWLDNDKFNLQPGTFVHVTLHVTVPPLPTAPSEALFLQNNKTTVAVVQDNKLTFKQVETGLDDGTKVQIRSGLQPGQTVALNVPGDIVDGAQIQPVPRPAKKTQP